MNLSLSLRPRLGLLSTLLATSVLICGCGGDEDDKSTGGPSGTVDVDGSSTVFRISDVAREAFEKVDPKVNVVVGNHGTGGGFGRYLKGEVDVVDASRAAKPDEEEKAKAQGIDWARFLVGYDGIAVVVNKKNTFVKSLTVAQLKALLVSDSKVKTWKDLDPSWPDRKVVFYTPDKDSGTYEFFVEAVLGKGAKQRDDIQASPDDNFLVKGVSGDEDGVGYFGYAYYAANAATLTALGIKADDTTPLVVPNPKTILDKSYAPLSRPLYIYVKKSAMGRPAVASFVRFYLEGVAKFAEKARYVAPTAEDQAANKATLAALPGGPSA